MTDDLQDFETRLKAADLDAEHIDVTHPPAGAQRNPTGDAMRLAIDLVAAVVIAVFIGVMLDRWLGTRPWFLLSFIILGVAAGFRNFYVFAGKLLRPNQGK